LEGYKLFENSRRIFLKKWVNVNNNVNNVNNLQHSRIQRVVGYDAI